MITWDGQEVASFGSNDDMLENRLIGYAYDLDQNKGRQKILEKTDTYVIQQVSDRFAEMDYVESWGNIDGRFYFLIRSRWKVSAKVFQSPTASIYMWARRFS